MQFSESETIFVFRSIFNMELHAASSITANSLNPFFLLVNGSTPSFNLHFKCNLFPIKTRIEPLWCVYFCTPHSSFNGPLSTHLTYIALPSRHLENLLELRSVIKLLSCKHFPNLRSSTQFLSAWMNVMAAGYLNSFLKQYSTYSCSLMTILWMFLFWLGHEPDTSAPVPQAQWFCKASSPGQL